MTKKPKKVSLKPIRIPRSDWDYWAFKGVPRDLLPSGQVTALRGDRDVVLSFDIEGVRVGGFRKTAPAKMAARYRRSMTPPRPSSPAFKEFLRAMAAPGLIRDDED